MYRPKGWETSFEEEGGILDTYYARRKMDYEAGADAMLEGLRAESLYEVDGRGLSVLHELIEVEFGKKGDLVFIPEEDDATK